MVVGFGDDDDDNNDDDNSNKNCINSNDPFQNHTTTSPYFQKYIPALPILNTAYAIAFFLSDVSVVSKF